MLTKLRIRQFKRFRDVAIDLGQTVVFIGPNNSGKTTALQALALWDIGLKRWNEKRKGKTAPEKRPGVTINRRDLLSMPVPDANLLWRNLHVRDVETVDGKPQTRNIRVDISVEGVTGGKTWQCGFEFDYANDESFYCRPLRLSEDKGAERMAVPEDMGDIRIAFLPPMSGLAANETRLDPGAINVRLGEGRTAEVLRNLCHQIVTGPRGKDEWDGVTDHVKRLFGVELEEPRYVAERGEITMSYRDSGGIRLDLSCAGRGLQQTLLLLAHLSVNPRSVLLIDEPDAHLEILRQRQIYDVLTKVAQEGSQVVAASHSEIVLNEAADRDVVVAFVGEPHRIDDRGSQLLKSLKEIEFDQYYQAELTGWVLYLEGATDLAILRTFAAILKHPARERLERPFVHYIQNLPQRGRDHFRGLREARPELVGYLLCDRLTTILQSRPELQEYMWQRREIENYLCQPETLLAYAAQSARDEGIGPLFEESERDRRRKAMEECITDFVPPVALRDQKDPWWKDTKASDELLDRLFDAYFKKLDLSNLMRKTDYHVLARYVAADRIAAEVGTVLDGIVEIAERAKPAGSDA